ncbi:hypothetical protein lacNasYZ03_06750 [Lactobacillus nasalidis]|uniref:TetR/AcrR family transcriptional regulator n=1 Tax=Lactobacillus nasalidis TaxID=2797258 RepID=A0ABQ3W4U5_9LACO|nr:hypothetical protein [Lactobacillus nasalidis]GHV97672.1 hypothetical protein lacNasYZ01_08540 [Lactobacillus nasalidis]GHV98913.1 hypothetical protein lacNasYZ02_03430 [Lactobacillus nasalidis]GHW00988.1 hypothetical protein lacNasYZ03_06750 [Lactobacillus nasalidis]
MITSIKLLEANQIMAQVLGHEDAAELNVKNFCELAACSRPTFYAHYGSMRQLGAELFLKKLDMHFSLEENGYGTGLQKLLTYMAADRWYLLNLLNLIKTPGIKGKSGKGRKGSEFAASFPLKVEKALRQKTVHYVDARSASGDYSVKTLTNAAHIVYAILYEWLAEDLRLSPQEVYDRCQLAVAIIEDQISKKAVL